MSSIRLKRKQTLLIIILIQAVLLGITFDKMLLHPTEYTMQSHYDGMKNYFTFHGFVNNESLEILKYEQMNYPFGEYVYFTDSTPIISVPLKWFVNKFKLSPNFGLTIFHYFLILSILCSSVLLFYLFSHFKIWPFTIIVFAISLPWLCPQFLRLSIGHFNLSLSWLFVLILLLLVKLVCAEQKMNTKRYYWLSVGILFTIILSAFFHLYYLILLSMVVGYFAFGYNLVTWKKRKQNRKLRLTSILLPFVAIVITLFIVRISDHYFALRQVGADGYNLPAWRLHVNSFFTAYPHSFFSNILYKPGIPYESYSYLGVGVIILSLIILCLWIPIIRAFRFGKIRQSETHSTVLLVFVVGLGSILIGFGNDLPIGKTDNFLSPLYFIQKYSDRITQFRCLGRFSWVFFWTVFITLIYVYDRLVKKKSTYWKYISLSVMAVIFSIDVAKTMTFQKQMLKPNLLLAKNINPILLDLEHIDFTKYQAILALPMFHVGSENFNYTLDPPNDSYNLLCYQASVASNLPLINSVMSRTPVSHAISIFEWIEGNPDYLNQLPSDKPILVLHHKILTSSTHEWLKNEREPANTVGNRSLQFIHDNKTRVVMENADIEILELTIK